MENNKFFSEIQCIISSNLEYITNQTNHILNEDLINKLDVFYSDIIKFLENNVFKVYEIDIIKVKILGKNSIISEYLRLLSKVPLDQKKKFGKTVNIIKEKLSSIIDIAKNKAAISEINLNLLNENIDITLPVYYNEIGKIHPISQVVEEVVTIFSTFGFSVKEGPEIEDEKHNFTSLNFPDEHPAKDDHDTFYFYNNDTKNLNKKLLRTHTSTVQIRAMEDENRQLPLKIIVPGRVYRSDYDATHTPVFNQLEGLYVAEKVSIAELKWILTSFCSYFFEIDNVPLRFRPSYFPFTTPSFEVDIACSFTKEKIQIGAGDHWLEILGAGIVHPNVLSNCGIDNKKYQGFAFGMGLERITMLKYGFSDLRAFFNGDYRWIQKYGFSVLKSPSLSGGLD